MSKKKISQKNAVFALEPDGFSIHTLELSAKVTGREYIEMKETLYHQQENDPQKGWMYRKDSKNDKWEKHVCNLYCTHGVRVILECNNNDTCDTHFVRMVINPRKIIDPDSSYLGILPPEKSSIKKLKKSFQALFEDSVFFNDIDGYKLSRLDLCTNIRCDNQSLFRELVRVLRKLPTPPKYERKLYKHEDKKKANRYNKHYLRYHCGTHELIIYDKTYQISENNLVIAYEKLPKGVLRFEVHCEREYLRKLEKKHNIEKPVDLLWFMIEHSQELLTKHFDKCFSNDIFVQVDEMEERIKKSRLEEKTKEMMLKLGQYMQRIQSVDKALDKMKKEGYNTDNLLEKFKTLEISPIPLRKDFCAKQLPGPVHLLRAVADGDLEVRYEEKKWK